MRVLSMLAACAIFVACRGSDRITYCAGIGLDRNAPSDTTIRVGQAFVARYYEGGYCAGAEPTTTHLDLVPINTWYTPDTLVLQVDSATGQVTGRASGDTEVRAHGQAPLIHVHVR